MPASTAMMANGTTLSASSVRGERMDRHMTPATSGTASRSINSIASSFQPVEPAHVDGRKRFANAIDENAQHHHRDEEVKENAQLDDQWHAVGGERNRGQKNSVLGREQCEDLR